ncbi:Inositol oxygenase [Seminavis robusta]|uniref:Inositol oxygenase n=1 Tax=Seminavis robusta TaxID=568900 RepID=A0A9N8ESH4_9STRA|nr:Inositol oxygenase [Seminavis robusta]|eukprot:Sro1649_g288600.1 Inositol oxygenase (303) ;mRNA; f:15358-16451
MAQERPGVPSIFDNIKTNEKADEDFRIYNEDTSPARVVQHYKDMRRFHTVSFYRKMEDKYCFGNGNYRRLMTIEEAFDELEHYVDASDPDLDLPNKLHLLQTAEGIRRAGHPDWFQLVGLLHDMGKIMFLWGRAEDGQDGRTADETAKQWALGGDTFVVGCKIPDEAVVFPEFNHLNPDMHDKRYNSLYGMYEPNCGLDELFFSWGHDEYMWRMLVANDTAIPQEGLDMIRYHSAYPMHDKGAYQHLLKEEDHERLEWIRLFNRFDLYTKDGDNDIRTDMETLWPYYKGLLNKYGLGGKLKW